jgi:hypothetical protein
MAEQPPVQTHIRRIIVGTPVRKVTGAQAQRLEDLTNVRAGAVQWDLIQFREDTGEWRPHNTPDGLIIAGGGIASIDSAGGDF